MLTLRKRSLLLWFDKGTPLWLHNLYIRASRRVLELRRLTAPVWLSDVTVQQLSDGESAEAMVFYDVPLLLVQGPHRPSTVPDTSSA